MQNFWVENIEKEAALRFAWQLRYSKQFASKNQQPMKQQAKPDPPPMAGKSFKENISDQIEKIQSKKSPIRTTSRQSAQSIRSLGSSNKRRNRPAVLTDMRPPTAKTKALLYDGISAHGEGRIAYLKKRKQLSPEEKFEFPVLSSCQYGWKMLEYAKEPNKSKFGRTCIVRDTFYRSSGIDIGH